MSAAIFECGNNTLIELYQRGPSKPDHNVATFEVSNIEEEVNAIREKELILRSTIFRNHNSKWHGKTRRRQSGGSNIANEIFFVSQDSKID